MKRWLVLTALGATGCLPGPGPCETFDVREIVYTADGLPAFAGQAVLQTSCGNGGFCHAADDIPLADRFGVPLGLGFDVRLAATSSEAETAAVQRLVDHQTRALRMRGAILQQVQLGRMPPTGGAGEAYRCQVTPSACGGAPEEDLVFDRFDDDGTTFRPMPTLLDPDPARRAEAEEILRNWLSCGTPVVERTVDSRRPNPAGYTVPECERTCVDVRWPSIYERIIAPSCASSRCHDEDDPAGRLDLATGGAEGVHARLVAGGQVADGAQCRATGMRMIEPSAADESLLFLKVAAASSMDVCGSRMPLAGNPLGLQRRCVIFEWIACGACVEADGGACAACLDRARTTCNADPAQASGCGTTAQCSNRVEL
ncbi:MAG: hypothetical protein KF729_27765 [Sandaracinaceae bacterium]|nr:hypothetical protein [Sandaracinaceae bacterium]